MISNNSFSKLLFVETYRDHFRPRRCQYTRHPTGSVHSGVPFFKPTFSFFRQINWGVVYPEFHISAVKIDVNFATHDHLLIKDFQFILSEWSVIDASFLETLIGHDEALVLFVDEFTEIGTIVVLVIEYPNETVRIEDESSIKHF